jgi:hypothetical protein
MTLGTLGTLGRQKELQKQAEAAEGIMVDPRAKGEQRRKLYKKGPPRCFLPLFLPATGWNYNPGWM